jgi:hypothetical protein
MLSGDGAVLIGIVVTVFLGAVGESTRVKAIIGNIFIASVCMVTYRVMLLTCEYMSSAALITFEFDS